MSMVVVNVVLHSAMPAFPSGVVAFRSLHGDYRDDRAYMEKNFDWEWAPSFAMMEDEWEGEGDNGNEPQG